jgi:hypothetical protein
MALPFLWVIPAIIIEFTVVSPGQSTFGQTVFSPTPATPSRR